MNFDSHSLPFPSKNSHSYPLSHSHWIPDADLYFVSVMNHDRMTSVQRLVIAAHVISDVNA